MKMKESMKKEAGDRLLVGVCLAAAIYLVLMLSFNSSQQGIGISPDKEVYRTYSVKQPVAPEQKDLG